MKTAWIEAERIAEVCRAAESWRDAGAIDQATLEEVERLYPEEKRPPGAVWRALVFFFVTVAIWGVFGMILVFDSAKFIGEVALVVGAGLVLATEGLLYVRIPKNGASAATAFWSVAFLALGLTFALDEAHTGDSMLRERLVLLAAAGLCAAAARRWGPPLYAFLAAVELFFFLATFPAGRILWLGLGAALVVFAAPRLDRASLAPSYRGSFLALAVAGLLAIYAAVNTFSLDHGLLEMKFAREATEANVPQPLALRLLSAVATGLVPLVIVAWGIRSRRTLVLDTGILLTAVSLVTLRAYVHIAPLEGILSAGDALLVATPLLVRRALARAPEKELSGFTAEPLFESEKRQQALQMAAAVASFSPAAARGTPEPAGGSRFEGGGGDSGGGGASDSY